LNAGTAGRNSTRKRPDGSARIAVQKIAAVKGDLVGWNGNHVHVWTVYMDVKMDIRSNGESIPFCACICECGQWKWRLSPEVLLKEEYTEL